MIKFNQNAWLNAYIDMNAGLRKKKQNMILKETLMLTNNGVSGKTIENVKKYRDTKCHNRTKKELFSIRTKLSYYKVFHRTSIINRTKTNKKIRKNGYNCK